MQDYAKKIKLGSQLLTEHRSLWSFHPFANNIFSWEQDYPDVSSFLRSWTQEEVELFEQCPQEHPNAPQFILDLFYRCREYTSLPNLYDPSFSCPSDTLLNIKERKRQQLVPFLSCIHEPSTHYIDWCCGKGHLGRLLNTLFSSSIVGIENNLHVIEKGRELATGEQEFILCDVLNDSIPALRGELVALHSCGSLLTKAMEQIRLQSVQRCFLVSCCYHKISAETYEPMTQCAKNHPLFLSKNELRLPSTLENHPSPRSKRRRRADMRYRLSIDSILQEIGFHTSYTSFPPVPDGWKDVSFSEYVALVWEREGFPSIPEINLSEMEQKGGNRLRVIRALSSFRSMFARVLEVWINADRALWLQEMGYDVELGLCMPTGVSPRNIAIRARYSSLSR